MARKKSHEILEMAVNKIKPDMRYDFNGDGKITAADARLADIEEEKSNIYSVYDDKNMTVAPGLLDKILYKSSSYDYDIKEDPVYRRLKRSYENDALKAAENIYGIASSLTGGYGNSYAASAASGILGDYGGKLDKQAQELEQKAYDRHRDEIDFLMDIAAEAGKAEARSRDKAGFLARFGDYSGLKDMGVDVTDMEQDRLFKIAQIYAKYGDYSLLENLGVDTGYASFRDFYNNLLLRSRYDKNIKE